MRYSIAMISLSPRQLAIISSAARSLPVEKRGAYLQRIEGLLKQRAGRFNDADVAAVAQLALNTLTVSAA